MAKKLGRIAGWDSPDVNTRRVGGLATRSFAEVERSTFFQKEALMEKFEKCKDDELMGTETYYPSKGACFR